MAYTTIAKPTDHFNTITYTGTGSSNARTGVGHQPDLVWIKNREATDSHILADSTSGVTKYVSSDANTAETTDVNSVTAFGADGFTVGSMVNVNTNTEEFVAWCWKANGGTTSSNTSGSITSTVQANTTAGFSIVSYTGTGSAGTVGHGLGAVPKVVITKSRSNGAQWAVFHGGTEITSDPATDYYRLSTTAGATDSAEYWNDTMPTSTVFSLGADTTNGEANYSSWTYVAYCFTPIQGYSHFGTYWGSDNSADGPMVYCGFRPRFIIVKRSDGAESWLMQDTERSKIAKDASAGISGNPVEQKLIAEATTVENSGSGDCDFYSTGFKPRDTDGIHNWTDYKYIYMAFAEMPVVGTNGTIALAR
tara:strand:- start:48 stop:1139 length:1092 start_codon:yes stop_codon:yes gene_type:complete